MHEKIHDAFVAAFVAAVKGYKIGDPMDESTYIGPITRRPQLDVLARQVTDAKKKGARLLTGGRVIKRKGNWFEPRVFTGVNHRMALMRDESFGPIIGIQKVKDDAEAARLMNDTRIRTDGRRLHARRKTRAQGPVAGARGFSVLELLRSRESPSAVVGRRSFGHRPDAIDLRNSDLHAAEGVAFAGRVRVPYF